MKLYYIGVGAFCIFIVLQFSLADMISTSIRCDGVALLSGSFTGQNQSYNQRIFTDDRTVLSRDLKFTGPVESTLMVNFSGAIGYDKYSDNRRMTDHILFLCSLMDVKNEKIQSENQGLDRAYAAGSDPLNQAGWRSGKQVQDHDQRDRSDIALNTNPWE